MSGSMLLWGVLAGGAGYLLYRFTRGGAGDLVEKAGSEASGTASDLAALMRGDLERDMSSTVGNVLNRASKTFGNLGGHVIDQATEGSRYDYPRAGLTIANYHTKVLGGEPLTEKQRQVLSDLLSYHASNVQRGFKTFWSISEYQFAQMVCEMEGIEFGPFDVWAKWKANQFR